MDGLDVLEPQARDITIGGERLEIRPLAIGAYPKIIRLARPIVDSLLKMDELPDEGPASDKIELVLEMLDQHGERVFQCVAIAIGREVSWVEALDGAEFIDLAVKVYEANRDFFVQKLAPLLAKVRATKSGRGPTQSSS